MKSCSYGTTCRTPPTTTYSPEPREARRPTASPSAVASRDIAETHTPRARVCQGRERARHEPGWSAQGRWRWSGPTGWAHTRVVRPMSDRPSKECRIHVENNPPPPRRGDHRPRPPRSARRSRAGRLYVCLLLTKESLTPRARQPTRTRLSRPPALLSRFSLVSWPTVSAPPATPSRDRRSAHSTRARRHIITHRSCARAFASHRRRASSTCGAVA